MLSYCYIWSSERKKKKNKEKTGKIKKRKNAKRKKESKINKVLWLYVNVDLEVMEKGMTALLYVLKADSMSASFVGHRTVTIVEAIA